MSMVSITHSWADGSEVEIAVEVDSDYPDALSEAEVRCLSMYHSVVPDVEVGE